jgi:hypothetical protein
MASSFRQKWMLRDLIQSWREFRDFVLTWVGAVDVTKEQEERFLVLKARIASRVPSLAAAVSPINQLEVKEQLGSLTELLNRYRTLRVADPLDRPEREAFEESWHRLFLFLNSLKAMPWGVRGTLGSLGGAPTGLRRRRRMPRSIPGAGLIGFVLRLGFVAVVAYVLLRAFGVRLGPGGRPMTEGPVSAGGIGQNALDALHSLTAGAARFLEPVTSTYGFSLTYVLVGILLLALAYWFFVRK